MSSDDLDGIRFKFYVERGYFPSDNTVKNIIINRHAINNIKQKVSDKVVETVANEEDEYNLFLSEIYKLDDSKKNIRQVEKQEEIIKEKSRKVVELKKDYDISIENYEEQKKLFLDVINNQSYNYSNKEYTKKTENKNSKKPDITKAIPKQTIDLHGLTRDKAYLYIKDSVLDAISHNESPLLVIHGKGLHNEYGRSLVKESLYEYILKDNEEHVEYYHKAPKHLGGSGAMLLYLKIKR